MNVEYTARKYVITPTIRKEVETGLNKIRKILGDRFETKVILAVEKRQHKAEITIDPPHGPIIGLAESATVSVLVHKFPSVARTTEVHLVHAKDSVALRPMTLEEAIKEAHFRDRDVFVFRDHQGKVMVLHRTREGKMELIEAP